jgi:hypothetical protein
MSIFGSIMSAIFGPRTTAQESQPSVTPGSSVPTAASSSRPSAAAAGQTASSSTPQSPVDVEAVLNGLAARKKERLNWRTSIVDLMKLLDLDSSLAGRKQLAQELHYTGDVNNSASMNIWLHKEVMKKLAENGGKIPEDLKHG